MLIVHHMKMATVKKQQTFIEGTTSKYIFKREVVSLDTSSTTVTTFAIIPCCIRYRFFFCLPKLNSKLKVLHKTWMKMSKDENKPSI